MTLKQVQSVSLEPSQVELGKPAGIEQYLKSPAVKPKNFDLQVAQDIKQVAIFQAAKIIASLQQWQKDLDPEKDVNLVFATGKSQLMAIAEVTRIKENWGSLDQAEKALLKGLGVDFESHQDAPFDSSRIKAFHLDTIFPQRRDALHSYAVQVNAFCDRLGINQEKRLLWYGDVKDPRDTNDPVAVLDVTKNRLSDVEYKKISASIKQDGLRVDEFKSGTLAADHPQYAYLEDMQSYLKAYAQNLRESGGGHIILFGVGSGYEGQGHVGFVEAEHLQQADEAFLNMPAFISEASHSALAGNIKANGGIDHAFTADGKPTVGAATLSAQDFRANKDATIILTITGAGKESTARAFLEKQPSADHPATVLHGIGKGDGPGKSVVIVGPSCFNETIYGQLPELFDPDITSIAEEDRPNFLTRAILAHNLRNPERQRDVYSITNDDIVGLVYPDAGAEAAQQLRSKMERLIPPQELAQVRQDVVHNIKGSLVSSSDIAAKLGLKAGDSVLHISPHLDDVTLAFGTAPLRALEEAGVKQHVITATPGDSAVATTYVLNVLEQVGQLSDGTFNEIVASAMDTSGADYLEKTYLDQLRGLLESSFPPVAVNDDHKDFNFWAKLSAEEKELRAKLALLSLIRHGRGRVASSSGETPAPYTKKEHIAALRDILAIHSEETPEWTSPTQPEILRYIKEGIRIVEDRTAFMACGAAYDDYQPPMHPTWYTGGAERERTLGEEDIKQMKREILRTKPKVIVLNGEGFMDHEAHCLTEMATRIALEQLVNEGNLNWECKVVLYRGVWDRTEVSAKPEQMLLKMSPDDLKRVDTLFRRHYRSQVPALVPDGGCRDTFFSERVIQNARKSADSLKHILGDYEYSESVEDGHGVLAFDVVDLTDDAHKIAFANRTRELEDELNRVRDSIERGALSKVVAKTPSVNLGPRRQDVVQLVSNAGLSIEAIFSHKEQEKLGLVVAG